MRPLGDEWGSDYAITVSNAFGSTTSASAASGVSAAFVVTAFSRTGFGEATTGGGVPAETDPGFVKVSTRASLVSALADKTGAVKVIAVMNDLDLGLAGTVWDDWIDHGTFTRANDGIVDFKGGSLHVTPPNPNSFVRQQINWLEANRPSHAMEAFCGQRVLAWWTSSRSNRVPTRPTSSGRTRSPLITSPTP